MSDADYMRALAEKRQRYKRFSLPSIPRDPRARKRKFQEGIRRLYKKDWHLEIQKAAYHGKRSVRLSAGLLFGTSDQFLEYAKLYLERRGYEVKTYGEIPGNGEEYTKRASIYVSW